MLARLPGGRVIGLTLASFAIHAAEAVPDLVAREIVDPVILAELSILWPARAPSAAVAHFPEQFAILRNDQGLVRSP
jgi:hypothetical protein